MLNFSVGRDWARRLILCREVYRLNRPEAYQDVKLNRIGDDTYSAGGATSAMNSVIDYN
jgi:hypothetical protein